MRPILAALALSALALAGCGSACQDLAFRICACQLAGALRDNCEAQAKAQISAVSPSQDDQNFCQSKLATCADPAHDPGACDALKTAAGKAACGLGY